MNAALTYAETHFEDFVAELEELLRIPSVSTDSAYREELRRCAQWLKEHMVAIGLSHVTIEETGGHPVVYAEYLVDDRRPTVLVYGHYDVQPPDPIELWRSPPFEPVRQDNTLYARGASDDKGQMFMHLKAAEAYLKTGSPPPVNLKFIIEGEEETGSIHLAEYVTTAAERLGADVAVISDTAMFDRGVPSITYGLRGLAYVEVELTGPERDLHSGIYGGGIENPGNVLARLIGGLHDSDHRITVPGFYDNVRDLTEAERATFRALPFDEQQWMRSIGVGAVRTEAGYSLLEALSARPTLDVNGLWSGYQGEGAKTVLPAKAGAKLSSRLVPDQGPEEITQKLRSYFEHQVPPTVTLDFRAIHTGRPVLIDTDSPAMQAAAEAMEGVYGRPPYFKRDGASIPVVADLKSILGLDTVLMGFGLDSDALHAPNEHFGLDRFQEGIQALIRFMEAYARRANPQE